MHHTSRRVTPTLSANKAATLKRALLLGLLTVIAVTGVVFSGSFISVYSSNDRPALAPDQGVDSAGRSDAGALPGAAPSARANTASASQPAATLTASDEQARLNHAQLVNRAFASMLVAGPIIEAAKADTLTVTPNNGDGKADPGDTITYTVTLKNTGDADATGVSFTDTIDTHTTLVPGSLMATPLAVDDTYTATGNVSITHAAPGLLANDFEPLTGNTTGFTATAETKKSANCASCATDNVTINANGGFTYDPPPGFTGDDTFTYTTHAPGGLTATGTVKVTVSNMIWFINNNVAGPGDGRLSNPFKLLSSFSGINSVGTGTNPKDDQSIFLYSSATGYIGSLTLRSGQKLFGQGAGTSTGTTSLATLTGITLAPGSATLPSTGGTNPFITSLGITLNANNTVRGLDVSGTSGTAISGSNFGTLTLAEVNVNSNAAALSLNTGTLSGPVSSTAAFGTVSSAGGTDGILLNTVAGTMTATGGSLTGTASGPTFAVIGGTVTVTYNGGITQAANNAAVSVTGGHATGTLTFQTGTISATGGTGLQFDNADGTYLFSGTTTMNGGDAGIDITNGSGGNFTFGVNTSITNPSGDAFLVNGGGGTIAYNGTLSKNNAGRVANIQSRTGGSVSLTGTISSTGTSTGILGQSNTGGQINFSNTTKTLTTGASNAVTLTTNNGATINFTNGLDIDTTSGIGFQATGGGIVNINTGTNTINSTAGQALDIDACQINFTFNTVDSSGSGAQGIDLTNLVANSIFTVSGTTTINNTTGVSINISAAGGASCDINFSTTNITNRKATGIQITSVGGTVDFGTTTIANPNNAGGFGIRVDSSSAVINVATANISFTNQTVAEADANADSIPESDGDGDAIFIKGNTNSNFRFNLNGGTLADLDDDGVDVRDSGGVNLTGVTITRPNRVSNSTQPGHHGFYANELRGANNSLTNCTIREVPSGGSGLKVVNVLQNFTLTSTNSKYRDSTTGESFFVVQTGGGTTSTVVVTGDAGTENSLFTNLDGQAFQTDPGFSAGSTTLNTTVSNTTFKIAAATATGNNGIIIGSSSFPGVNNITITNNTLDDIERGTALAGALHVQGNNGSITGTISGNTIKNIPGQRGIHIVGEPPDTQANGTGLGIIDINIDNNNIYGLPDHEAIFADLRTRTGDSELKITNNCIGKVKSGGTCTGATSNVGGTREAIEVRSRTAAVALGTGRLTSPRSFKLEISNNNITANTTDELIDIDSEDMSSSFITITGNTLSHTNGAATPSDPGATTIKAETGNSSICLDIRTNTSSHATGSIVDYALIRDAGSTGTYTVEGAGAGAVSAAAIQGQNTSGTASVSGTINFNNNTNCAQPVGMLLYGPQRQDVARMQQQNELEQFMQAVTSPLQQNLAASQAKAAAPAADMPIALAALTAGIAPSRLSLADGDNLGLALAQQVAGANAAYSYAADRQLPSGEIKASVADNTADRMALRPATDAALPQMLSVSQSISNQAIALNHTADNSLAATVDAPRSAKREKMMLSHAIVRRSRPSALAAAALAGETVTVNGSGSGFTLPQGKTVTITFQVTLNNPPNLTGVPPGTPQVSNQGSVSGTNFASVQTHDPDPASAGGASPATKDATLTPVDLFNPSNVLTSDNNPADQGTQVTFTATLSSASGTPTGTVDFIDTSNGNAVICNDVALSAGVATCQTNSLSASTHNIRADYSGDGNFDPASSNVVAQVINPCLVNPVVTSTADSGAGTLREAITSICAASNNNVTFNLGAGPHTITILSTLVISKNVNITNTLSGTNGAVTINANGGNFNAFRVDSPVTSANISNLTVTGVNATSVSGGGLLAQSGTVTLTGMLFTGNTVINGDGGGVTAGSSSTVNLRNSTISGNTARNGGGIFSSGGTLNLLNVTVTNNNANGNTGTGACPAAGSVSGAGGGLRNPGNDTNATNSILAGNTACAASANVSGAFATLNNSLIDGDRRLAALADNGGATRTHALLSDSPALDAGDNCVFDGTCASPFNGVTLATDQRGTGFARKRDAADPDTTQTVDIGAFEADPSVQDITNKTTAEDTPLEFTFNVGDSATAFDSITASSSNTTLVPNANAVVSADTASTRKLTLTPALNAVGTTTITVTVTKTISGTSVSMSDTFDLTVTEVNDAPTANTDTLTAVNEDSGLRTIPFTDLTTNDSRGGGTDENGQTLTVTAVSNPVGGTVQINGTNVEFTPAANFAGTASFDYTVQDNGTTNGVNDFKSANGSASFTVTAINDEPSFTKGADETVAEDAGAQTVNPWATGISPGGGADESAQTLTFNITNNTNTALFSVQPAVSDTGVLTYTPAANAFGTAAITLELKDNGGTAGGGDDTSPTQTFNITVTPVADTPSVTNASTTVNVQTTSGLVIDRNAVDSGEVTHFKITNIQNGTLFQNNGTTPINDGDFITYAEGNAGLRFTPTTDSTATGSFDVQAATDGTGSGLSGTATATITVTKNGTSTDVTSSANPSYDNQTVTFTATVTSNTSLTGPPTGTVDFLEGVTVICNDVALDGTGKATCQINTLTSAGSPYNITATYSGDAAFDTSTSSGLTQTVNPNISLTVNMTSDAADANVGDGVCDTDLGTAGDQCTLRAAIQETNSIPSDDIINFNIPTSDPGYDSGTGVYTITLLTALADINGNVQINGLGSGVLTVKRSTAGGTPDFRIFRILSGKTVMIFGMTITNGKVSGIGAAGGGIENVGDLTLDDMVVTGNSAPSGGGISNFSGGTLIAGEITVSDNTTTFAGGGIINIGTMSLTESTISGNSVGAVANAGGIFNNGSLTVTNTTISGNSAGENGGGIHLEAGSLTAVNVTITNNRADSDNNGSGVGGGISRSTGTLILHNTIVAGNFNENGATDAADDVSGALDASGLNNLIGDGTNMTGLTNGSNGNQVGTLASPINARLGPLANNGGLTKTHALLPGSPALDAGSDTAANNASLVTDQRCSIHNRYVDSDDADTTPTVDIGAFEAQVSVQDIADQSTNEDTQLLFNFNVSDGLSSADVTVTSSDTGIVPNGNISVTGASSPLTLTIDPAANQFGTLTITVTVTSSGHTMTDTFQLTVNSVNDVPSFTKGADQTVGEDAGPQSVPGWATGISAGPANESTQTLSFEVTGNTNTALFSTQPAVSSTGTLTYTPADNANGTATITLVIKDSGGTANGGVDTSASQTFNINVTAVNDVPTANAQSVTTAEDTPKAITLSGSDVETPSGSLTFTIGTGPTNGMLSGSGANRTYTPNADYNGPDSFTFKVNDGTTDSALATVTINVTEVNDAPSAVNDMISNVGEDSAQRSIPFSDLTGNDSKGPANENGQTLTINNVSNAVGGTVSISGSNVLFTPTANFNGAASFQYTVVDNGTTNGVAAPLTSPTAATVSFNITAVADTPSVTNATTNEDTQTTTGLVITRNAADGAEVTHFKITAITGGTLFQNNGTTQINNGDFITVAQGAAGLKFTPALNSNANGSFTVQASLSALDGGLGGGTVTATITVNPVNDAPTLDAISNLTINEDAPLQSVNLTGITAGGGESQTLLVTATSNNTALIPNPAVTYTSPNATGSLSFTPVANQSGSALITVTVSDGGGTANGGVETVVRTFTVTVNAVNDGPVNTVPGAQITDADTPLTFSAANSNLISIADIDAGAAAVQVTLNATSGTLTLSTTAGLVFTVGDGTSDATMTFTGTIASINAALNGLVFTPTSGFDGTASVQITTNDLGNTGSGGALSDSDTVQITVNKRSFLFSLSAYTVAEAEGHALITVMRTGGTTNQASVDYATSDLAALNNCNVNTGDASARCDYTAVGGTLVFMPGQSTRTFTVPVINDVYIEGPEVLTLTLSNPTSNVVLGTPNVASLTITDNDNTPGAFNPIDTREFLIRQLYLDTLNREPDPAGLAAWLNRLNTCPLPGETLRNCDEIEVASAFFRSPEFFDRTYFVYKFYEAALGRQPQYDEYQRDIRRLTGFLTAEELDQRKREFAEEFVTRSEFQAIYNSFGSGQPFVDAVLAKAGSARPGVGEANVTTSNRVSVINRLGANQISRGQALRELMEAPEISQRFFNKAFVVVGYFAFLRRNPDAAYLVWINMLNTTGDYREMIRGFLQSPEYRLRFGPI